MTKKELERKITNGESVWCVKCGSILEDIIYKQDGNYFSKLGELFYKINIDVELPTLFATQEDAEWELKFGNLEKTIKLQKPPTWKEVKQMIDGVKCESYLICANDFYTIEIQQGLVPQLYLRCKNEKFNWFFTKESYINACETLKDLFLGEEQC